MRICGVLSPNSEKQSLSGKPKKQKCRHLYVIASQLLILALLCGTLWGILRDQALPGSEIFALGLLAVLSHIGGRIAGCVKLPPLLGMLIVGFLFRNLPFIPYHKDISTTWTAILRNIALVVILLRAGLGLCPDTLRRLSCVVFKLSFIPCIVEAATCATATHFLLGLPWVWSFLLGGIMPGGKTQFNEKWLDSKDSNGDLSSRLVHSR